jgi:hypothetical protein
MRIVDPSRAGTNMGNITFTNTKGIADKASSGISIAFPDVCKTPSPPSTGVPIPYPNVARTAAAKQLAQKTAVKNPGITPITNPSTAGQMGVGSGMGGGKVGFSNIAPGISGAKQAMTNPGALAPSAAAEAALLRNMLNDLHQQLLRLPGGNPDAWQAVLQDYVVTASALYMTITDHT